MSIKKDIAEGLLKQFQHCISSLGTKQLDTIQHQCFDLQKDDLFVEILWVGRLCKRGTTFSIFIQQVEILNASEQERKENGDIMLSVSPKGVITDAMCIFLMHMTQNDYILANFLNVSIVMQSVINANYLQALRLKDCWIYNEDNDSFELTVAKVEEFKRDIIMEDGLKP
jgi:hypothetical protein